MSAYIGIHQIGSSEYNLNYVQAKRFENLFKRITIRKKKITSSLIETKAYTNKVWNMGQHITFQPLH